MDGLSIFFAVCGAGTLARGFIKVLDRLEK